MGSLRTKDTPRLVEVSSVPSIYIDGVAKVTVCGPVIRILCFEFKDLLGERVRMPNVEFVRPFATLGDGVLRRMAEASIAETIGLVTTAMQ